MTLLHPVVLTGVAFSSLRPQCERDAGGLEKANVLLIITATVISVETNKKKKNREKHLFYLGTQIIHKKSELCNSNVIFHVIEKAFIGIFWFMI